MNNENSKESGFNWTGATWPEYCTTTLNGMVVGKVWRGDDGLLYTMVLKCISKGFETIGYYIKPEDARAAVERWVKDNRPGLVPNTDDTPEHTPEHTPGPWQYYPEVLRDDGVVARAGDKSVTDPIALPVVCDSRSTMLANARLIAAAPELLEALKRILPSAIAYEMDSDGYDEDDIIFAQHVITKAEGK
jgi:hypothetical protein